MKNYTITVNGVAYDVVVEEKAAGAVSASTPVVTAPVNTVAKPVQVTNTTAGNVLVTAGAAGKVFKVEASVGMNVKAGDTIVVLEAMKMEIPIVAASDGVVASVLVQVGDMVESGATLATMNA
ncbi:MAG: biotin/lipoyl-containing protein [Lachnospiraceae bacterium]